MIRLNRVPFMDITGLQTLEEVIQQLHKRNIVVKLCEANRKVLSKLDKAGILQEIGTAHYHSELHAALEAAEEQERTPGSSQVAGDERTELVFGGRLQRLFRLWCWRPVCFLLRR